MKTIKYSESVGWHRELFIGVLLAFAGAGSVRAAPSTAVILSPGHPGELMPAILRAYHSGMGQIMIPPGIYKLPEPHGAFYLSFDNLRNFRIRGKGVTLLRTDPTKGGIQFTHCRNVTLEGVTLRCNPIPFTQGRIVAMSRRKNYIDIRINKGYQTDLTNSARFPSWPLGMVFSAKTFRIKPGTRDIFPRQITKIGRREFRIFTTSSFAFIRIGDLMEFRGIGIADVASIDCRRMSIDDVTVMAGTGFCFYEGGGGGNRYIDDSIVYPPKPRGAVIPPLRSSNADAKNILLADNTFINPMRMPDDRGSSFFDTSSLIWLQQCKNILLADNHVIEPGPAMKKLVGVGPDVSNVKRFGAQCFATTGSSRARH